jgi:hypothetical protein
MRRALVVVLAKIDELMDLVVYRPAVVRAFLRLPRWWSCELAKLSVRLDDRWQTGYWQGWLVPGRNCEACHRRASLVVLGGIEAGDEPSSYPFLDYRPVHLCLWCRLDLNEFPIRDEEHLQQVLTKAGRASTGWTWDRFSTVG